MAHVNPRNLPESNDMPSGVVAAKVTAATIGAAVAGFVLWLLGEYVFDGNDIPAAVEALVMLVVPAVAAFASGYVKPRSPAELR